MSHRHERVASMVREVVASLVTFEIKDPRVQGIAITDVELTGDLHNARVFYAVPGDETAQRRAADGLRSAAPFLRRELGRRIRLRTVPELEFRYDASVEYGARIDARLQELGLGPQVAAAPDDSGDDEA